MGDRYKHGLSQMPRFRSIWLELEMLTQIAPYLADLLFSQSSTTVGLEVIADGFRKFVSLG